MLSLALIVLYIIVRFLISHRFEREFRFCLRIQHLMRVSYLFLNVFIALLNGIMVK